MASLSVVIPSRVEGREFQLARLVGSLASSDCVPRVIVVDDSGKGLALKLGLSGCTVIVNQTNMGLAFSRNQGARESDSRYTLFVDDDNVVDRGMCLQLVQVLEAHPEIVAVGPLTYHLVPPDKIWFAASKINLRTMHVVSIRDVHRVRRIGADLCVTDNLHNCFAVRTCLGDRVGWFDETMLMTGTEFDLFMRIRRDQGGLLATALNAYCYHDVPISNLRSLRSLGFDSPNRVYDVARSRGVLVGRYGSFADRLSVALTIYPLFSVLYLALFVAKRKPRFVAQHVRGTAAGYVALARGSSDHSRQRS